jgi:hypothetical protein
VATEKQVYDALVAQHFSMAEASGIMGNIQNESSFDQEAKALDSNGFYSYGLVQWNAESYPQASGYVTGNPAKDLADQMKGIVQGWHSAGIQSGSAAAVAGQWASQFEKCQGCEPGGPQWTARVQNAERIFQQAQSGHWPPGGKGPGGGGGTGPGQSSSSPGLLQQLGTVWGLPISFWESTGATVSAVPTAVEDTAQALAGVGNTLNTLMEWVAWWFVPSHIVRVFCGLVGAPLVGIGIFMLTRTGKPYSVNVPVAGQVPAAGGSFAPVLGIIEITVGSILLFIAFHNLPASVTGIPSLFGYINDEIIIPQHKGHTT